jgi:hypothetical protein
MNNINSQKRELSTEQREELLRTLKTRFEKNSNRLSFITMSQILIMLPEGSVVH